jgi:hypothetical protein
MNENDYWDCPYCEQPTPPEHDKECHCGMRVSHHLSVPALCKQLRETQQRESALIVENKRLKEQRDRLAEAALAVVDRWKAPYWEEVGQYHYIDALRKAVAAVKGGQP